VAVLAGSLAAAAVATVILRIRNHTYQRLCEAERAARDHAGIPDVCRD
jgi:NhaA family Na+:H+ antiporter